MSMDREIASDIVRGRRRKRIALSAIAIVLAAALFLLAPGWLRPSVSRSRVRIAPVERGMVEAVIEASGTIIPESEKALSSPVEARVIRIVRRAGQTVRPGDTLVELDTTATRLEIDRLEDRLAQRRNEQAQMRLDLERSLADLQEKIDRGRLDQEILATRLERNRRLRAEGLVSEDELRESDVESRKAALALSHLGALIESERRSTETRLKGSSLDLTILEKELLEARHRLELASARAEDAGVVTWVVPQEGVTVRQGETIAKIARIGSFGAEATVSDVHAAALRPGVPVRVIVGGDELSGKVAVEPTIESGAARFRVDLDKSSDPRLRANLRVDVLVVTATRDRTLRLMKPPRSGAGAVQQLFVVRGNSALRTAVRIGLTGREFDEILDGLVEGDEVIVSDMQDYAHLAQVAVR